MKRKDEQAYIRKRKWFGAVSLIMALLLLGLLTVLFAKVLAPYMSSSEEFMMFLEGFGWKGRFILLGLQCIQVIFALIPGEVIEFGAGYAYGVLEGTLICMMGIALCSSGIFLLVKKFGTPLVELFLSREKISQLRFLNDEKKLKRLVFLLFFIPGTPKDALTYFVGLTKLTLQEFLTISLIARIPSVISSTICGHMMMKQNYVTTIIVYAITAAVSGIGYLLYKQILKHKEKNSTKKE